MKKYATEFLAPHSNRSACSETDHPRARVAQPLGPLRDSEIIGSTFGPGVSRVDPHRHSVQHLGYFNPWSQFARGTRSAAAPRYSHHSRRRAIPRFEPSDEPTTQQLTVGER
jgi:hypothetical protein